MSIAESYAKDFLRKLLLRSIGINGFLTDVEKTWSDREGVGMPTLFEEWLMFPYINAEKRRRKHKAQEDAQLIF